MLRHLTDKKGFPALLETVLCRSTRSFCLSSTKQIKKIVEREEGNKTIFEGKILPQPWEPYILKSIAEAKDACPVCKSNLDIKHTDVLILSQFVKSDGRMLPRRVTGLCMTQQKRISTMVTMAHKAGLMSQLNPPNSKKDPKKRPKWKKCNTYFDESTIELPSIYRKKQPDLFKLV